MKLKFKPSDIEKNWEKDLTKRKVLGYMLERQKKRIEKEIDETIRKLIKDYGCVLVALQYNDDEFIKDC